MIDKLFNDITCCKIIFFLLLMTMLIIILLVMIIYYLVVKNRLIEGVCTRLFYEKKTLESKIKDLSDYKRDISKTFNILDNELNMINNHIISQPIRVKTPVNYVLDKNIMENLIESENEETVENKIEETVENKIEETVENKIEETKGIIIDVEDYSNYKI
jgi:hypothetical protein